MIEKDYRNSIIKRNIIVKGDTFIVKIKDSENEIFIKD